MPAHLIEHGALAIGGGRHRGMPAFAGQRNPASAGRYQSGDAETRSRAEHADRRAGDRSAAADHLPILRGETRERQRQRGEIIDHLEPLEGEPGF